MSPRFIVQVSDPFMVTCLSKKNPMGSVLHTVIGSNYLQTIHPLDRNRDTCCYIETNQFGQPIRNCYNKVFLGRTGFLCKMHHDLDIQLKPQFRTIYKDESPNGEEGKLLTKLQAEVDRSRASAGLDYSKFVQWGWSRQPLSFIEDGHGNIEQDFSGEDEDSDY